MSSFVKIFIKKAPAEQQADLKHLQKLIEANINDYVIVHPNNFPVYTINEKWIAGLGSVSKHAMFYFMDREILDRYENRLGNLRTGKSCIAYKKSKTVSLDELNEIIVSMLQEADSKRD